MDSESSVESNNEGTSSRNRACLLAASPIRTGPEVILHSAE